MNYKVSTFPSFDREFKRLAKHYKTLKQDLLLLVDDLLKNPEMGTSLGNNLRKVRMSITSKGKGKSGGARVITYTIVVTQEDSEIKLLTIYDKSERSNISDKELIEILKKNDIF